MLEGYDAWHSWAQLDRFRTMLRFDEDTRLSVPSWKNLRSMSIFLSTLAISLSTTPSSEAQFGLNKIKKAVDKGLDVAQKVDELTFTTAEEVELGRAISQRIRTRFGVAQDIDATRYVSLVGLTVAARSGRPELPWQWIILDTSSVNAYAAPGGIVHITRGALAVIQSEAELAGVLGHEIGHIVEKHTIKALQKDRGTQVAQESSSLTAGSALFEALADKATDAILTGFGRSEELEADQVGIDFASSAGYDPAGLIAFLETLAQIHSDSTAKSGLFRSHPETEERIKKIDKEIKREQLDGEVTLAARYESSIAYDSSSGSTGGAPVEGARGVAPAESEDAQDQPADATDEQESDSGRFSLAKLKDPFQMGSEEESSEVSGAGAGRAVGEEDEVAEDGPKNPAIVTVEITPEEISQFIRDGGLS